MHVGPCTAVSVSGPVRAGCINRACCSHNEVSACRVRPPLQINWRRPRRSLTSRIFTTSTPLPALTKRPFSSRLRAGRSTFDRLAQPVREGAQAKLAVKHLAAARQDVAHGQAAAEVQKTRGELRQVTDPGHLGDGLLVNPGGRHVGAQMKADGFQPRPGTLDFLHRRHGLGGRKPKLGGKLRIFRIEFTGGVQRTPQRQSSWRAMGSKADTSAGESKLTDNPRKPSPANAGSQ